MHPEPGARTFGAVPHRSNGTEPADQVERDPDNEAAGDDEASDEEAEQRPTDRRAYVPFL